MAESIQNNMGLFAALKGDIYHFNRNAIPAFNEISSKLELLEESTDVTGYPIKRILLKMLDAAGQGIDILFNPTDGIIKNEVKKFDKEAFHTLYLLIILLLVSVLEGNIQPESAEKARKAKETFINVLGNSKKVNSLRDEVQETLVSEQPISLLVLRKICTYTGKLEKDKVLAIDKIFRSLLGNSCLKLSKYLIAGSNFMGFFSGNKLIGTVRIKFCDKNEASIEYETDVSDREQKEMDMIQVFTLYYSKILFNLNRGEIADGLIGYVGKSIEETFSENGLKHPDILPSEKKIVEPGTNGATKVYSGELIEKTNRLRIIQTYMDVVDEGYYAPSSTVMFLQWLIKNLSDDSLVFLCLSVGGMNAYYQEKGGYSDIKSTIDAPSFGFAVARQIIGDSGKVSVEAENIYQSIIKKAHQKDLE